MDQQTRQISVIRSLGGTSDDLQKVKKRKRNDNEDVEAVFEAKVIPSELTTILF